MCIFPKNCTLDCAVFVKYCTFDCAELPFFPRRRIFDFAMSEITCIFASFYGCVTILHTYVVFLRLELNKYYYGISCFAKSY